jgi:hypothetical protein
MVAFSEVQKQLADHVRDPQLNPAPANIEDRRLAIYRDLIFNNIESFLSGGFPIIRSIFSDELWQQLVRDFIRTHKSDSPFFLEISQEFLLYLQEERQHCEASKTDPSFIVELAHYEWVELALDVATEVLPSIEGNVQDLLAELPLVSPLAWCLSYQYPVHKLGPDYQPTAAPELPTFIIVYRNRNNEVQFMESNSLTIRLLNLISSTQYGSGQAALEALAAEMQHSKPIDLVQMGHQLLLQLQQSDILF